MHYVFAHKLISRFEGGRGGGGGGVFPFCRHFCSSIITPHMKCSLYLDIAVWSFSHSLLPCSRSHCLPLHDPTSSSVQHAVSYCHEGKTSHFLASALTAVLLVLAVVVGTIVTSDSRGGRLLDDVLTQVFHIGLSCRGK